MDYRPRDIKCELSKLGHFVHNVTKAQINRKVDPNNTGSDDGMLVLRLLVSCIARATGHAIHVHRLHQCMTILIVNYYILIFI